MIMFMFASFFILFLLIHDYRETFGLFSFLHTLLFFYIAYIMTFGIYVIAVLFIELIVFNLFINTNIDMELCVFITHILASLDIAIKSRWEIFDNIAAVKNIIFKR